MISSENSVIISTTTHFFCAFLIAYLHFCGISARISSALFSSEIIREKGVINFLKTRVSPICESSEISSSGSICQKITDFFLRNI